ncbi:hypothetical protein, partial [Arthrobacter glacialis]
QFNINKLVSIKLGTLLSSQTTTTPSQHTQTNKQSAMISAEATHPTPVNLASSWGFFVPPTSGATRKTIHTF